MSVAVEAGYVNKEVIVKFGGAADKTLLARMPDRLPLLATVPGKQE